VPNLSQRAEALHFKGQLAEAEQIYRHVLQQRPDDFRTLNLFGVLAAQTGRQQLAAELFMKALRLNEREPVLHNNLGIALTNLRRLDEAVACFDAATRLSPDYSEAFSNRGVARAYMNRLQPAVADFERAIKLNSGNAQAHYHKGLCCLAMGDVAQGWHLYEWRKQLAEWQHENIRSLAANRPPAWQAGVDLSGKTVFVYSEQGLGDTIQFCRYARLLLNVVGRVVLGVPPSMRSLLQSLDSHVEIVERSAAVTADYEIALMSLPLALGVNEAGFPSKMPYLSADGERVSTWRGRIGDHGFKIGICWQTGSRDNERSFPLSAAEGIAALDGVRLLGLQKSETARATAIAPSLKLIQFGDELDPGPNAFVDTAALMECVDLIVTADTAVAHLAGALARPTWLALKHVPDWRWRSAGSTTSWYPTVRLFRQPRPGDWQTVFADMQTELAKLLRRT
jgi:tetratricopeptide (TPR) repeat protein